MKKIKLFWILLVAVAFIGCSKDEDSSGSVVINGETYPISQAFFYNYESQEYNDHYLTFATKGIHFDVIDDMITKIEGNGNISMLRYTISEKNEKPVVGTYNDDKMVYSIFFKNDQWESTVEATEGKIVIKKSGSRYNVRADFENRGNSISIRYTGTFKNGALAM